MSWRELYVLISAALEVMVTLLLMGVAEALLWLMLLEAAIRVWQLFKPITSTRI